MRSGRAPVSRGRDGPAGLWAVTVPANGKARLKYREVDIEDDDE